MPSSVSASYSRSRRVKAAIKGYITKQAGKGTKVKIGLDTVEKISE